MCTSVCCIDLIGRPPESCSWQRQARRPVDCQTSFDRGPSPKSTGPLWKDARALRKGIWVDWLDKDSRTNRTGLIAEESGSGKEARVKFRVLGRWARLSKLELRPSTGRSHQLRVQLAARGLPILGDGKYGATSRVTALDGHLQNLRSMHGR